MRLNPMGRKTGKKTIRNSECIIEIGEEGLPHQLRGELTSIQKSSQYASRSLNILGWGAWETRSNTHNVFTVTFPVGTDEGFWEQMEIDLDNGVDRTFAATITTEDSKSMRLNGGRTVRYNDCHMLEYTGYEDSDASESSTRMATVVFYAPRNQDSNKVLRQFR